jgi:hypothetical protein
MNSEKKAERHSHVRFPVFDLVPDPFSAPVRGDVLSKRHDVPNGLDGNEIDADNDRVWWHLLRCDLKPSSGGSAQIDQASGLFEKIVLFVELDELECRPCSVPLLSVKSIDINRLNRKKKKKKEVEKCHRLCELVVLVETACQAY